MLDGISLSLCYTTELFCSYCMSLISRHLLINFANRLLTSGACLVSIVATSSCTSARTLSNTMAVSSPAIVAPTGKHTATVIFLHGLGDTGFGWSPVFEHEIRQPHIKYICPHAPTRAVTLNMGMRMPAWFDLHSLSIDATEDEPGIIESTKYVHQLIDNEIAAGIAPNRIVVGGFSMGGALALYAALTYNKPLAGIIALSSFLALRNKLTTECTVNRQIAIFQGHGDSDPLLPLAVGKISHEMIKKFNPNAQFKIYANMAHSTCNQELKDVKEFIKTVIP